MGIGGTPIAIPEIGKFATPGVMYTARCRFGYGDTARTAGGASDGCHVWTDTALEVTLFQLNPVAAADSASYTSDAYPALWGGITVYTVHTIVKVAFVGLSAATIGDTNTAAGWVLNSDIVVGTTDYAMGGVSSAVTKPAYGLGRGMGPVTYLTTDALQNKISLTPTGDATAGIMDVYIVYSLNDEEALATTSWGDTLGS